MPCGAIMHFIVLVRVYELLEGTSKRLEKTHYLSEFLRSVDDGDIEPVMRLVQGKTFPDWDPRELGIAAKLLIRSIATATGFTAEQVELDWAQSRDLGTTASNLVAKKKQRTLFSEQLTVDKVFRNLRAIAEIEGQGGTDIKTKMIAELLSSAQPQEAKYLIRIILSELRVGLGEGTMRDAILWACFGKDLQLTYDGGKNESKVPKEQEENLAKHVQALQEAYDVANDFVEVMRLSRAHGLAGLSSVSLEPGRPMKVMLFQKSKGIHDAFETVGTPAALEYKYDGFRLQIHKLKSGAIKLFTRRLEEVTDQFPDVIAAVRSQVRGDSFILDAEVVGYNPATGKYKPFQEISQRIKRKYDIEQLRKELPVEVDVFDVAYYNGNSLLKMPYRERRDILEDAVDPEPLVLKLSERIITADETAAEAFYKQSLAAGNEGVMAKNLTGIYKPGSRVGFGVKVKPVMETLEVVIVGAEQGEGKRGEWFATFVIAVRDPETDTYLEIGRVGTGLKEKKEEGFSFGELTEMLKPLIISEGKEVKVQPKIIIEVDYEEIQRSPTYSSGFALRFPRFVKLRDDRAPEDANTIDDVHRLFEGQRGRNQPH